MNKKTTITEKYVTKPFFNYWEEYGDEDKEEYYIPLAILMEKAELVKKTAIEEVIL